MLKEVFYDAGCIRFTDQACELIGAIDPANSDPMNGEGGCSYNAEYFADGIFDGQRQNFISLDAAKLWINHLYLEAQAVREIT